jgi:Inosine-uridine nucleoside N-ribohydrolase
VAVSRYRQGAFYELISRQTRLWSEDARGERWYAADALAMAWALQPDGATRVEQRPLVIELSGTHTRGATVVDWNRQTGQPDNTTLLIGYEQERSRPRSAPPSAWLSLACMQARSAAILPLLITSPHGASP